MNRSGELTRPPLTTLQDWLRWLEVLHPQKIDLSLERICAVLEALGLASPPFRIASVAGTNGKGSCVATLEAVFLGQGYRVGAYTSPHLWRFNERVRVDGAEVSDAELMAVFEHIDRVRGETTLSYFEYTTAAACVCFAERAVDLAVLEVGLGGRLDAVNAMDADLALITSIDLDHQHWLGDTRDAIGVEKAGIMRPGRPAIVADRDPPLPLLAYAKRGGVPLRRLGADFDFLRHDDGSWDFRGGEWRLEGLPKPALRGAVQYENAAACLAAAEALAEWLPIEPARLGASLARVTLAGRLQSVWRDGVEWVFDVAHNPEAAAVLAGELRAVRPPGRTLAIVGLMADKDIRGVLEPMSGLIDAWWVTRAATERASEAAVIAAVLGALGCDAVQLSADVHAACKRAQADAGPGDRVVVFGSFYIVGPALSALEIY